MTWKKDNMLDFSKIESGELNLERARMNLVEVVETIGLVAIADARKKNLAVLVYLDPDLPTQVSGNETGIREILKCLVSNALKYTSEGEIRIHATPVPRQKDDADLTIRFDVEDTGIGVARDDQDKLFEPSASSNSVAGDQNETADIGLAACRRLADMLGGSITVDSVIGKGSAFTVRLPVKVLDGDSSPSDRNRFVGHAAVMVTHSARKPLLANRYLSWLGIDLWTVKTLDEGVRKLAAKTYDRASLLILSSDVCGEDVEATLKRILAKSGQSDIRILAVVRNADEAQRLSALGLRGVAIITQPVLRTSFMNAIVAVLTAGAVTA